MLTKKQRELLMFINQRLTATGRNEACILMPHSTNRLLSLRPERRRS